MGNRHYCVQRIPACIQLIADKYFYYFTAHHLNERVFASWIEGMDYELGDIDDWKLIIEHDVHKWIQPGRFLNGFNSKVSYNEAMQNIVVMLWTQIESLDRLYTRASEGHLDIDNSASYRYVRHSRGDYAIVFEGALYENVG